MTMECEATREKLDAWLDGELGRPEADQLQGHLEQCPACREEKRRLERLQFSLEGVLRLRAAEVAFEPFWREVERRIAERVPWHLQLLDWLRPAFSPSRLAWAVPIVILALLGLFSLDQYLPGLMQAKNNRTTVDSIDAHGMNVALFREHETRTTVIWLFEDRDDEETSSAELIQDKRPF